MRTGVARIRGGPTAMRVVIGGLAIMILPVSLPMLWHPLGPAPGAGVTVYLLVSLASAALGTWWILLPAPSRRNAITFAATSDLLIFTGTAVLGGAESRICGTTYFGMIAMLTAFLLGWRLLLIQVTFSLLVVGGYVAHAVVVEGRSLLDLYVFIAPAVTVIASLPTIIQILIELGRRGMGQVYDERNRDELTGLRNRRGVRHAARALLRQSSHRACLVAVLDLDRFKEYNDRHGHLAGDAVLTRTADVLRHALAETLVGRVGGDEFIVIALRPSPGDLDVVVDAIRALVTPAGTTPPPIRGRVGFSTASPVTETTVGQAVSDADAALNEAKRDRTHHVVRSKPSRPQ